MRTVGFTVTPRLQILFKDMGINQVNVLRRAQLPEELLSRGTVSLSTDQWFQMWRGLEEEAQDPLLPIRIGQAISFESFDPPVFAALCSPDLNTALERISLFKRLCAPLSLNIEMQPHETKITFRWLDTTLEVPPATLLTELVYFVQLARLATRASIIPKQVLSPLMPEKYSEYRSFFGTSISLDAHPGIVFSAADARRPLLTANHEMWKFFEPQLRARLSELDSSATVSERVTAVLLELLPGGNPSIEAVSRTQSKEPSTCGQA